MFWSILFPRWDYILHCYFYFVMFLQNNFYGVYIYTQNKRIFYIHWNLEIVLSFPLLGLYRERVFPRNSPPRYSLRPFKSGREWASRPCFTSHLLDQTSALGAAARGEEENRAYFAKDYSEVPVYRLWSPWLQRGDSTILRSY